MACAFIVQDQRVRIFECVRWWSAGQVQRLPAVFALLLERRGFARKTFGFERSAGLVGSVTRNVVGPREIGLALGVQPADPAPAQRVGRRIAVHQVGEEEVRAECPVQLQREDPDAREPHAGMVVEIARLNELASPVIEGCNSRSSLDRLVIGGAQAAIPVEIGERCIARFGVGAPDRRALFEIALEVDPPEHLGDKLVRRLRAVLAEHRIHHLGFADETGMQPRRELRDVLSMAFIGATVIVIAAVGIGLARAGKKVCKASERGGTCRFECHDYATETGRSGSVSQWPGLPASDRSLRGRDINLGTSKRVHRSYI